MLDRLRLGDSIFFNLTRVAAIAVLLLLSGVIASLADEAAWHAIENKFGYGVRKSTTTELKVNYLRPIVGDLVIIRAYLVRAGQTLCVSRVDIFDEKKNLAAIGIVTYMLL